MKYYVAYEMVNDKFGICVGEFEFFKELKNKVSSTYPVMSRYPSHSEDYIFVFQEQIINTIRKNLGTYCYFLRQ